MIQKKAKKVEIPEGIIDFKEYEKLLSHIHNSALWYATNYPRNSGYLKEKLYDKGYPRESSQYKDLDGSIKEVNFVEEAVNKMIDISMIDDETYAESLFELLVEKGKSLSVIRFELRQKYVDPLTIETLLENFDNDEKIIESIDKSAQKILRSSTYKKQDTDMKKNQKLIQGLMSKGFNYSEIELWKNSQE